MMHFLYKIRVTLSSKKCMCFGPEVLGGRNERTYMCFARTDANDSEATFAVSKSRSAAVSRRTAVCYRLATMKFTPEALLAGDQNDRSRNARCNTDRVWVLIERATARRGRQ